MKKRRKTLILCGLLLVIAVVIFASVRMSKRGLVTVQTGQVADMNLTSLVTATGEIKPRNYINLGANTEGPAQITAILVKEGDRVKRGQVLARLASVQPAANVSAQQAVLKSALASSAAAEASLKVSDDNIAVAKAQVKHDQVDVEQQKANFERSKALYQDKLIALQNYQAAKATYDLAVATVLQSKRRVDQAKAQRAQTAAQLSAAQVAIAQQRAMLTRSQNILSQYEAVAPLDGVVTDLPVRVGETVVPGIQNSAASTIMTIADMSLITAEVHVDETDIVGVKVGQPAAVTIDALPNQTFAGKVMEIGDTAIVRSTGVAASQSTNSSQEAKDFKVVIALDIAKNLVRPGLSCTAKITTATRSHVLAIPIQALTIREAGQLHPHKPGQRLDPKARKSAKKELQGVFVVDHGKAEFHEVKTGITGTTNIEVLSGLKKGEPIVTGSYEVIRTIRNGAKVRVNNKLPMGAGAMSS
ncbi:MAG: efflux RND transporter periplasmic adaptor subunit [Bryobacteraceae bacterium]